MRRCGQILFFGTRCRIAAATQGVLCEIEYATLNMHVVVGNSGYAKWKVPVKGRICCFGMWLYPQPGCVTFNSKKNEQVFSSQILTRSPGTQLISPCHVVYKFLCSDPHFSATLGVSKIFAGAIRFEEVETLFVANIHHQRPGTHLIELPGHRARSLLSLVSNRSNLPRSECPGYL